jgi:hypothetical protein
MKSHGFSWLSTAIQTGNRVAASLVLNATLHRRTRANIEVDIALRERRFLDAHSLMTKDSTVATREMTLALPDSSSMRSSFNEMNGYIKSLCHALAQTVSLNPLKEERLCDSCLHSVSAILSQEKRTSTKLVGVQSLQKSIQTSDCGICAAVLECILANNADDEEVVYETVASGNEEEVVIDVEQSFKALSTIVITSNSKICIIRNTSSRH